METCRPEGAWCTLGVHPWAVGGRPRKKKRKTKKRKGVKGNWKQETGNGKGETGNGKRQYGEEAASLWQGACATSCETQKLTAP